MASQHKNLRMFTVTILFISFFLLGAVRGDGIHIKHIPPYMVLQDAAKTNLASSSLPSELAGALGLKNQKPSSVIKSSSVLKRPAANVLITLLTKQGHDLHLDSLARFPLDWDVPFVDVNQLLSSVQRKFQTEDPLMLNLLSDDQLFDLETSSSVFKSLPSTLTFAKERLSEPDSILSKNPTVHLNSSRDADSRLMAELQTVKESIDTLKKNPAAVRTKIPDLLSFTLTGLKAIAETHGARSQEVKEAEKLVTNTVNQLTEDLKKIYGGNVMVEVIVTPATEHGRVRHTRSLKGLNEDRVIDFKKLNLALDWYDDFPVIFNIVLWLMLILILVVIFISYGMWNMNPNLESILYRVPQDEGKKNN